MPGLHLVTLAMVLHLDIFSSARGTSVSSAKRAARLDFSKAVQQMTRTGIQAAQPQPIDDDPSRGSIYFLAIPSTASSSISRIFTEALAHSESQPRATCTMGFQSEKNWTQFSTTQLNLTYRGKRHHDFRFAPCIDRSPKLECTYYSLPHRAFFITALRHPSTWLASVAKRWYGLTGDVELWVQKASWLSNTMTRFLAGNYSRFGAEVIGRNMSAKDLPDHASSWTRGESGERMLSLAEATLGSL